MLTHSFPLVFRPWLFTLAAMALTVVSSQATHAVWQPAPGTTWQWQLVGPIDTSFDVDMYDVDLFETPQSVIDELQADGRIVICYLSVGTWEPFRPDAGDFPPEVLGKPLDVFDDELWLDVRRWDLLEPIMVARLDLAASKGCDGVEPDNVDGFTNDSGFPLSYQDQFDFNVHIAEEAHLRNLSVGLKNDLPQVQDLEPFFDWALNEQCFQFQECPAVKPFLDAGKAVFGVEYIGAPASFCPLANAVGLSWLRKRLQLDAARFDCQDL